MNSIKGLSCLVTKQLFLWILICVSVSACKVTRPADTFDQSKAVKLSAEEKARMDVAFFNMYAVNNIDRPGVHSKEGSPHGLAVKQLANDGFEVAWIADKFYDFRYSRHFRKVKHGAYYWKRLKTMADAGDASAQCFFYFAAVDNYLYNPYFKPSQSDFDQSKAYLQKAAKQKQPQCYSESSKFVEEHKKEKKRFEYSLYGAERRCASCQNILHFTYFYGEGVAADLLKSMCWAREAMFNSDALRYKETYLVLKVDFETKMELRGIRKRYLPHTNCSEMTE